MTADLNSAPSAASRPKFWKTILFITGSVTFGGVAFALWNRRELTNIQAQMQAQLSDPVPEEAPAFDEEEVFF